MRIGRIDILDVAFPPTMGELLKIYMTETGDSCSYIAQIGVDHPELVITRGIEPNLFHLYAAISHLKENPENGLAVFCVAEAFAGLRNLAGIVRALESLESAGSPGCYHDVWYDDPAFQLGWYLADFGEFDRAITADERSLGKVEIRRNGPTWIHLGSVYHETGRFDLAEQCYREALRRLEAAREDPERFEAKYPPFRECVRTLRPSMEEREGVGIAVVKRLVGQATVRRPFEGRRTEQGVELSEISEDSRTSPS